MDLTIYTCWSKNLSRTEVSKITRGLPVAKDKAPSTGSGIIFPWFEQPNKIGYYANYFAPTELASKLKEGVDVLGQLRTGDNPLQAHSFSLHEERAELFVPETGRQLESVVDAAIPWIYPYAKGDQYHFFFTSPEGFKKSRFELRPAGKTITLRDMYSVFSLDRLKEMASIKSYERKEFAPQIISNPALIRVYLAGKNSDERIVSSSSTYPASFEHDLRLFHEGIGMFLDVSAVSYIHALKDGPKTAAQIHEVWNEYDWQNIFVSEANNHIALTKVPYQREISDKLKELTSFKLIERGGDLYSLLPKV